MVQLCDLLAHLWTNNLYVLLACPLMSIFHPFSSNVEEMQLPLALQQYDLFYNPLSNMPFHMFSHTDHTNTLCHMFSHKGHVCMHGHKFSRMDHMNMLCHILHLLMAHDHGSLAMTVT